VGDRDARTHERGYLAREVYDLLLRDALRRELELVELLHLLDRPDLEVAHQELVAQRVLARRLECILDLGPVGADGDEAIGGHGIEPPQQVTARRRCAGPRRWSACSGSPAGWPGLAGSSGLVVSLPPAVRRGLRP